MSESVSESVSGAGSRVSPEMRARLEAFAGLVRSANTSLSLVSKASIDELETRHIADSLQLLRLLPPACERLVDLGSGGGFPGLVLALCEGASEVHLIEANRRKVAFLQDAASRLVPPSVRVFVHASRIESLGENAPPPADVVTARALATLPRPLELAAPLLAPSGICLLHLGASARGVDDGRALLERLKVSGWVARFEESETNARSCILVAHRAHGASGGGAEGKSSAEGAASVKDKSASAEGKGGARAESKSGGARTKGKLRAASGAVAAATRAAATRAGEKKT